MSTLDELEAKVALMRKLGVTECDGLKLGTEPSLPSPEETVEQFKARVKREQDRRHDIMFAASATKPRRTP